MFYCGYVEYPKYTKSAGVSCRINEVIGNLDILFKQTFGMANRCGAFMNAVCDSRSANAFKVFVKENAGIIWLKTLSYVILELVKTI